MTDRIPSSTSESPPPPRLLLIGDRRSEEGLGGSFRKALARWARARGYDLAEKLVDEGEVRPCTGCLTCYRTEAAVCVHRDGYADLREKARLCECLILLSEITFGQASVPIKQLIDKGIGAPWGFCGPFPLLFQVGYGSGFTNEEAACFVDIVHRHLGKAEELHRQLKGTVAEARVIGTPDDIEGTLGDFEALLTGQAGAGRPEAAQSRSVCLLNGSLRGKSSTSHFLLDALESRLAGPWLGGPPRIGLPRLGVSREELTPKILDGDLEGFAKRVARSDTLVLALPLFCYSVPAGLLRLLVALAGLRTEERPLELFAIVYSGSPRPSVNAEALRVLRIAAAKCGWKWGGGLSVGGGLFFTLLKGLPFVGARLHAALSTLAHAIAGQGPSLREDLEVKPPIPPFIADLVRNSLDRSAARRAEERKRSPALPRGLPLTPRPRAPVSR